MITIIDYGMGNLRSVQKAFELFCSKVRVSSSFKEVLASDKVILPGVGAFSKAMEELRKRDLLDAIVEVVKNPAIVIPAEAGIHVFTEQRLLYGFPFARE